MFDRALFDAARGAVRVEDLAGRETKLRASGSERRGACPLCGAKAFAVKTGKQTWVCYVCEQHGDVVDLERALRGGTPVEAARRLTGNAPLPERTNRPVEKARAAGPTASDRIALETWDEGKPIGGTLVERYLRGRGIAAEVIAAASGNLRFHPFAKRSWDERTGLWTRNPAMLIRPAVPGPDGAPIPTGGLHATYLARDGQGKAPGENAKKMWGPQMLNGVAGGAWLIGPDGAGPVAEAEGAESTLSIATLEFMRSGRILRAVAALSLNRLQGGVMRDDEGRVAAYAIRPNPEAPAFTWPGVGDVWIGVDRDMSEVRMKGRTPRGKTCWFTLDREARAKLAGQLSAAAWKRVGTHGVRVLTPPPGLDWNDELRRRLALREGVAA